MIPKNLIDVTLFILKSFRLILSLDERGLLLVVLNVMYLVFLVFNSFDPATVILPARVSLKFFQNELQNFFKKFTKKTICDFISYPILIKFSKDHA